MAVAERMLTPRQVISSRVARGGKWGRCQLLITRLKDFYLHNSSYYCYRVVLYSTTGSTASSRESSRATKTLF